jgi:hypothetical protein
MAPPVYIFSNSTMFLCFGKMFADSTSLSQSLSLGFLNVGSKVREGNLTSAMQVKRNVNIRNLNCLVCGEVMSLINPLEDVVIVRINAFGVHANKRVRYLDRVKNYG